MKFLLQGRCLLIVLSLFFLPIAAGASEPLRIQTPQGEHVLKVDVATTPEELEHGLMGRNTIPADYGMLFWFASPRVVEMWMKDTPSPLDMLFIDAKGRITHIAQNTTPFSESIITHPSPAIAVLEVAGGSAERLNIKVGDRILHRKFGND